MTWTVIILLIVVGLLLLLLEVLVVPGTTFVGVTGFVLLIISIWQTYVVYGSTAGHYTLLGILLLTFLALYFSLKSKTWRIMILNTQIDSKMNEVDPEKVKPGDAGKTISRLAPAGKAIINGEYYEVHTLGEFIDQQTEIVVIKVEYSKILVKPKN
ncbi:MAG: NfeD family protein [Bacteroidales bacterium]|nr:NfeD family protein [Bacteroidales bacterium]MDZ4204730.1 NfeD family protein [Bacteroidales bacterium]